MTAGLDRRGFLGTAVTTLAVARLGMIDSEKAQPRKQAASQAFGPLKQIDAGLDGY